VTEAVWWGCLVVVTVATSAVSGVVGMAGGSLLLAAMLLGLPPTVAIPVHGAVQLVSNGSRAWFHRRHVRWRLVWLFALPLVPAGWLGVALVRSLSPALVAVGIGVFILASQLAPEAALPTKQEQTAEHLQQERAATGHWKTSLLGSDFGVLCGGALVGSLSPVVGATGILLGPFVLAFHLGREATIGTLAACQVFQHSTKVALFGFTGFDFARHLLPTFGLCAAAVLGSALGTRLLAHVDEHRFRRWVRFVLSVVAATVLYEGVTTLLCTS
jgi:uncharacterized protein